MRRSVAYCQWQQKWWLGQVNRREGVSPWLQEGLEAYAVEHAEIEQERAAKWSASWSAIRERGKFIHEFLSEERNNASIPVLSQLWVDVEMDENVEYDDEEEEEDF
ncbi:hypothetical protein E1B28_003219 [Marasmius oreades]|uniref:Uncharacterized protein n=1 Tax=Marasmius oreades TaxID=181124 RepID=A0A9P7RLC0_9AGAR|nr:uncharacterized protein E1B28_003219 [Marasmius oreades]KAG7085674.1 hypothetical protein E1B28_003219 [Marasmius oreades]